MNLAVSSDDNGTATNNSSSPPISQKEIRVYADGVFDLIHCGHFNALRQAKTFGDVLVVGVNSDTEVYETKKAYPVFTELERAEILSNCRWVDEVVVGVPYNVSNRLLDFLNCDVCTHGDDFVVDADGLDCYLEPRRTDRMRIYRRTDGLSTTGIVSRLLAASSSHGSSNGFGCCTECSERSCEAIEVNSTDRKLLNDTSVHDLFNGEKNVFPSTNENQSSSNCIKVKTLQAYSSPQFGCSTLFWSDSALSTTYSGSVRIDPPVQTDYDAPTNGALQSKTTPPENFYFDTSSGTNSRFHCYTSTSRLLKFIQPQRVRRDSDIVVYIDGAFDVFHVGHVKILNIAKSLGDYLIVGVFDDETLRRRKGSGFPVGKMLERCMNVLAMRSVDEIVMGAPWQLSKEFLKTFNISVVVSGKKVDCTKQNCGSVNTTEYFKNKACSFCSLENEMKCYDAAIEIGIYNRISVSSILATRDIVNRIKLNNTTLKFRVMERGALEVDRTNLEVQSGTRVLMEL